MVNYGIIAGISSRPNLIFNAAVNFYCAGASLTVGLNLINFYMKTIVFYAGTAIKYFTLFRHDAIIVT